MSDTKFTKGPWELDRNVTHAGQITVIHHCLNNDWVEVWSREWPDGERQQEANANLIASAPDLYEALCDMVSDRNELSQATIRFAENALAKARGE